MVFGRYETAPIAQSGEGSSTTRKVAGSKPRNLSRSLFHCYKYVNILSFLPRVSVLYRYYLVRNKPIYTLRPIKRDIDKQDSHKSDATERGV